MQLVSYENFSGGETGRLGTAKSQDGTFHGENVMPYANGLLGPRPGIVDKTPASMPTGILRHLGIVPVAGAGGVFIIGRTVYHFDLYNAAAAPTADSTQLADVAGNSKYIPHKAFGAWEYITVPGDKTYKITSAAVSALTGSPGGVAIEISGLRMLIAESQTSHRIFYNDPNLGTEFTGWNSDFFDIPEEWQVSAIRSQRQGVTIYVARMIYLLNGVPGVNAVQRVISHDEPPIHPWHEDIDADDVSWYIPVFRDNVANFNGSNPQQVSHLQELSGTHDVSPNPTLPTNRGLIAPKGDITSSSIVAVQNTGSGATLLVQHNGVWTRHTTTLDLSGMMVKDGQIVTFTDGGGVSAAAHIYHTKFAVNRPGFASDQFSSPGDASNTPFDAFVEFPRWDAPDGKEVRIRSVIVDFVKWNTGATNSNHFECEVTTVGAEDNDGTHSTTQTWDELQSAAASTEAGTPGRAIFRFFDDALLGGGFQLALRHIRGVAFKKITVELEVDSNRPRT